MIRKLFAHVAIVISGMYVVFFFIDRVNSAMGFINNKITKTLLLILCVVSVVNAALLIAAQRRQERRRRRNVDTPSVSARHPAARPTYPSYRADSAARTTSRSVRRY